jgi:hypothetical protein
MAYTRIVLGKFAATSTGRMFVRAIGDHYRSRKVHWTNDGSKALSFESIEAAKAARTSANITSCRVLGL